MTLMDDLLGDGPFDDDAGSSEPTHQNALDGLEISSRPPSEHGDPQEEANVSSNQNSTTENRRRQRSESQPDPEEEARFARRSFMEGVIPADVTGVAEQWRQFNSEFKVRVTQIRSQAKTLIYRLRSQGADINQLAKRLAPKGMVIREHHRARLAWIVLLIDEFEALVNDRKQKSSNFWDWIGQQAVALRTRIATDSRYQTEMERRQAFTQVFTRALSRHRVKYPPSSPAPAPKPRPAWQETLEDAMSLGAAI